VSLNPDNYMGGFARTYTAAPHSISLWYENNEETEKVNVHRIK